MAKQCLDYEVLIVRENIDGIYIILLLLLSLFTVGTT